MLEIPSLSVCEILGSLTDTSIEACLQAHVYHIEAWHSHFLRVGHGNSTRIRVLFGFIDTLSLDVLLTSIGDGILVSLRSVAGMHM